MDLIVQDFEEINLEHLQMVAKLLVNLEQGMKKRLVNNIQVVIAACARQIISLIGLAADSSHKNLVIDDLLEKSLSIGNTNDYSLFKKLLLEDIFYVFQQDILEIILLMILRCKY